MKLPSAPARFIPTPELAAVVGIVSRARARFESAERDLDLRGGTMDDSAFGEAKRNVGALSRRYFRAGLAVNRFMLRAAGGASRPLFNV